MFTLAKRAAALVIPSRVSMTVMPVDPAVTVDGRRATSFETGAEVITFAIDLQESNVGQPIVIESARTTRG